MTNTRLLFLSLITPLYLTSCEKYEEIQDERLDASQAQTLYQVSYGPKSRQVLDISLPKNRTQHTPVVIFIHGGNWVSGDKSAYTLEMQQFSDAGIACAAINYRFVSDITKVHHTDIIADVNMAVDFIASKSSAWQVSESRFGLVGQGTGGHLALSAAYVRTDVKVKACGSWGGQTNLTDADQLKSNGSDQSFKMYVGASLSNKSDTLKYRFASPYWMVNSYSVPTLLIHGNKDVNVPISNAMRMQKKLNKLHVTNSLVVLNGAGNTFNGKNLSTARSQTLSWFQGKL